MHLGNAGQRRGDDVRIVTLAAHEVAAFPVGEFGGVLIGGAHLCVEEREVECFVAVLGLPGHLRL